jgi:hypothetical protein
MIRRRLFAVAFAGALLAVVLIAGGTYLARPRRLPPPPTYSFATAPELFRSPKVNCAMIADAVNHFVGLGKSAGMAELRGLASNSIGDEYGSERVGYVCRVLFIPKGPEPLRPPLFGALGLPYESMPEKDWPLFPLASSGSSYFVLGFGRNLGGLPEGPLHYINYCEQTGTFRTSKVPVPTRAQALADAEALHNSHAWKAAKWRSAQQVETWGTVRRQAERTPP